MLRLVALVASCTLLAFLPCNLPAHGDASLPLYVAADGSDQGRCTDPAAPCRSIDYALGQAGKGSQIRVAAGRYAISDSEQLFLLVSGVVDVGGGYERATGFTQRGESVASILTGVPEPYREALVARGFHVIADTKAGHAALQESTDRLLALHGKLGAGLAASECVGGSAGGLPCDDVDLLAHLPFSALSTSPAGGNDVWGFVDLNTGREYVLAGFNIGTAVIDVSDPENPREVGFVDGQNASWRDIKVYQHYDAAADRYRAYAYVTTDGSSDGLFVIDLGGLPHSVARLAYSSQFFAAHNVYSTSTDFSTGLPLTTAPHLIVAGSNLGAGQYRAYALGDPGAPQFVTGSDIGTSLGGGDRSYMHDAASLVITDSRIASCSGAVSHCELLLDFNEEKLEIWDITTITSPKHLNAGSAQYAQRGYVHSGWWSEDRQFAFVHDELDEQSFGLPTTLRVFSLADLAAPALVGQWTGPTDAIDHNGFVRGNRYYMSNYSRGLTVLDISDPTTPVAVGRLDTYPAGDGQGFFGAWGAYPFLPSGTLAVSDMNSGVYLAADRSLEVPQGRLGFVAASAGVAEGQSAALAVARSGGTDGSVSVGVELVQASAAAGDVVLDTVRLDWPDGDAGTRNVQLTAAADGSDEGLELALVRLVDPRGGATLGEIATAGLYVADPGATSGIRFFSDTIETAERGFATAILVLQRTGSAAGAVGVDFALGAGGADPASDFSGPASGRVDWADGDAAPKTIRFTITDDGIAESDETFEVVLSNATGASIEGSAIAEVTIKDGAGTNFPPNAIAPTSIVAAENSTVTLDGSASNDPDGDSLGYAWAQTAGPSVSLSGANSAVASFTAPAVTGDTLLRFTLTVTDPGGQSDVASTAVTVTNAGGGGGGGSGGGNAVALFALALAALAARALRYRRRLIRRGDA